MNKALISVQEHLVSRAQIRVLDEIIKRNYAAHVSAEPLTTVWCRVPRGQFFTNYTDSRSSLVTMECPQGFAQEDRVRMMKACEKEWLEVTHQHPDELMLAIVEPDLMATLMQSNRQRLSRLGRWAMALNMLKSLLTARLTRAPLSFNPNL